MAVGLALAGTAGATQFSFDNGVSGSFDTTISAGVSVRTEKPDPTLIGIANGGTARSVNEDDGDRNYKRGQAFSELLKVTHDLELKQDTWGVFIRGLYFVDFKSRRNNNLGPIGRDRLGSDARILDAFVTKSFDPWGKSFRVRAGNQVISWGESTFIPNGINVINAADISKLRVPGSELKEAFIPTASVMGSLELTKSASIEAFAQFNHDKFKLDPRGSYFSNNDTASDDSDKVIVTFGRRQDVSGHPAMNPIALPQAVITPGSPGFNATIAGLNSALVGLYGGYPTGGATLTGFADAAVWAPRSADRSPSDHGQYGVAFRYLATGLNNTEFGLYFLNYHSRIPVLSGIKGTATSAITGGQLTATLCSAGLVAALGSAACDQARTDNKATYFTEYPENIRLYGVSFNTQGPMGVALQGEFSYRPNQPLQYATAEVILAALGAPNLLTGFTQIPGAPVGATAAALVPNGTLIQGWARTKMSQFQMTATKGIPNVLGGDQLFLAGEVGFTRYSALPTGQKFAGPAAGLPATPFAASLASVGAFAQQTDGFVTENSWGYRLVSRLEYSNLVLGANVAPRFAFNHDVKGVSQTFNEATKSYSLGANFDWQRKLSLDLSYNSFFGGRNYCGRDTTATSQTLLMGQPQTYCSNANPIRDRDFYSVVVTYSF
ncbi:MAG: DUF1302 domain-containing protein [Betaproteobacteria bacterium]